MHWLLDAPILLCTLSAVEGGRYCMDAQPDNLPIMFHDFECLFLCPYVYWGMTS